MKALISNDDGITASGIFVAKKAVDDLCDTYVVAPETQQSGIGHALTLYDPLRVNEYTLKDGSILQETLGDTDLAENGSIQEQIQFIN